MLAQLYFMPSLQHMLYAVGENFATLHPKLTEKLFTIALPMLLVMLIFAILYIAMGRRHNKILRQQINEDALTGLMTLAGLEDAFPRFLKSQKGEHFLLSELNVRDFSFVNRIYGSAKGDSLLISIATVLSTRFDPKTSLCARGYADNFYILSCIDDKEVSALDEMEAWISYLQDAVCRIENIHIIIKSGNVVFKNHAAFPSDIRDLISKAGYARRSTRESIVETFSVYDHVLDTQRENEEHIESRLEGALKNDEFTVLYQPKISLKTQKIVGAEALVRWRKSDNTFVPPDSFIPVLEKNGMVGKLDMYVYENVFSYLKQLRLAGIKAVPISVNLSRLSYSATDLLNKLAELHGKYGVPKDLIELEIEERFAGAGDDFIRDLTHRLHSSGYTISMDDFGSGQSSLNMLSEVNFDVVKFDQGFLRRAEYSEESRTILRHMVSMVKELGKTALCEGVETAKHMEIVKDLGCDIVQGFYYSRPIQAREFRDFLQAHS